MPNPTHPHTETESTQWSGALPVKHTQEVFDALEEEEFEEIILDGDKALFDFIFEELEEEKAKYVRSWLAYMHRNKKSGDLVLWNRTKEKQFGRSNKVGHAILSESITFFERSVDPDLLAQSEDDKLILTLRTKYDKTTGATMVTPILYEISGAWAQQMDWILYEKELSTQEFRRYAQHIQAKM